MVKCRFPIPNKYINSCILMLLFVLIGITKLTTQAQQVTFSEQGFFDSTNDTATIKRMLKAYDSLKTIDYPLSMQILNAAYKKSKATGYNWGVFISLNRLASESQMRGGHEKGIAYLLQALPYAEKPENIGSANVFYNNLGLSHSAIGKYEQALKFYNKALLVLSNKNVHYNNGTDSVGLYNNIGILWARLDEIAHALEIFKTAEKIAIRKNDTLNIAMSCLNISACYKTMNDLVQAEKSYNRLLYLTRSVASKSYIDVEPNEETLIAYKQRSLIYKSMEGYRASALSGLGAIYLQKKEYAKALPYLKRSLTVSVVEGLTIYEVLSAYASLGEAYLEMKDFEKAKPILQTALTEATQIHHEELLERLEPAMAKTYAAAGDYREALRHLENYSQIKDTLFKQEKSRSLDVLLNSRIAEKNKEMLLQQLYITQQKAQLQKKNFWIGGTVLGALLLVTVSFALIRNYRHKQVIQQSLLSRLEQKQEINQLKAQMRGEEQERKRIAHELHDGIASQLWAIRLNVESMQNTEVNDLYRQKMSSVFQQLNDATQDVRKTAHNLMPDLLLEEGLATALASLCEKMRKNTNLEVDFQEYGLVPSMDKEIELTIYRMVQELLQNVMKHAREATYLLVQLSCAGALLNITVEDNGLTFEEKKDGVGLEQIRKRVAALKGHFDLQHIAGKGTTAYLEFDLQHLL